MTEDNDAIVFNSFPKPRLQGPVFTRDLLLACAFSTVTSHLDNGFSTSTERSGSIFRPREHPVSWVLMQAPWAPERFVSWEFLQTVRGLWQWHRGSLPSFLAHLVAASPVCLYSEKLHCCHFPILSVCVSAPWLWAYVASRKRSLSLTTQSKNRGVETTLVLISAKIPGSPSLGLESPEGGTPKWKAVWRKAGEEGKGSLLWGWLHSSLLQFRSSITEAYLQYSSDSCRSDQITVHTCYMAKS